MKRIITSVITILALSLACSAAERLEFKKDSTFRIMQLTDLHLRFRYPDDHDKVLGRIRGMAQKERPDVIIITGDIIYGRPAAPMGKRIIEALDSLEIPWLVVYGNHDAEAGMSRADLSALYASGKYNINTLDAAGELADMEIPVLCSGIPAWYIYAMDSHDYCPDKSIGHYASFSFDQVGWMRERCSARRAQDGTTAPSVAFFHIPLHEYLDAWSPMDDAHMGQADGRHCWGIRGEAVCCGALNTGMFAAMREGGSIVATFAGHDHDSDYVACYKGIALCYGRYSGGNGEYNNLAPGARLIELKAGSREIRTWIRDCQGRIVRHMKTDGDTITEKFSDRPKGGLYGTWPE